MKKFETTDELHTRDIHFVSIEGIQSEILPMSYIERNKLYTYEDDNENIVKIHPEKHHGEKIRRIKELVKHRNHRFEFRR